MDYPAWEYKSDSQLRKICVDSFTNVYGHEPEVTSIHAGLECGILAGKMPGVDMISFGPTLESVHTPDECMERLQWSGLGNICWRYLKVYN